jgi:adenosine deaminase
VSDIAVSPEIAAAPKALLHDHLDGGVRPQTIIEISDEIGYANLPRTDAAALDQWFRESADSGSLVRYLETFEHTVAVMQTPAGLNRVAKECALDLAADGVVYAESRYAPEQHVAGGLAMEEVVEAVNAGFREGEAEAAAAGSPIQVRALLTAMRHAARSREIAELAVRYRDDGCRGLRHRRCRGGLPAHPPPRRLRVPPARERPLHHPRRRGVRPPEHLGGDPMVRRDRLGHGVRIVDDVDTSGDAPVLGRLAAYVRDARIPLEMCPSSNLQTGAAASYAEHPITLLKDLRFRVTVNTDNRLMSGTTLGREMQHLVDDAGWSLGHPVGHDQRDEVRLHPL